MKGDDVKMEEREHMINSITRALYASEEYGINMIKVSCDAAKELLKLLKEQEQKSTDGWVRTESQMPPNKEMVIGFTPVDGRMFIGFQQTVNYSFMDKPVTYWYIGTAMRSTKRVTKKVAYWMPLPEPPEEVMQDEID